MEPNELTEKLIEAMTKPLTVEPVEPAAAGSLCTLTWASGSVVRGAVGRVTARTWAAEVGSSDDYATADASDGIVAITTVWRPGACEIEIDVLGTEPGAVQAAWECEAEEAARKTGVC